MFGARIHVPVTCLADASGWISRLIRLLGFGHQDLSEDLIASSRFHRIIRRGREFGERLEWRAASQPDAPDPHSGLHFICLNANIARQFEFIQNAWLISAKFDGMSGEADPLLGNREPMPAGHPTDGFTLPQPSGINRRIDGSAAIHHGARRRVFLPAGRAGAALFCPRVILTDCHASARIMSAAFSPTM